MTESEGLGVWVAMGVVTRKSGVVTRSERPVATEVPCTVSANGVEVATVACLPADLRQWAAGFLFSSGIINAKSDLKECRVDTTRWTVDCTVSRTPDVALLGRRLYTSGCGRGVVYPDIVESMGRIPLRSALTVCAAQIAALARWLQRCSALYRLTGGVHSAGISLEGALPQRHFDDIGRHNAVDKAIGEALLGETDLRQAVLIGSGRMSSEILHKARRAGIAISVSRGAPTHQTVLRARDMGITVVGLARGEDFAVYSHEERIV